MCDLFSKKHKSFLKWLNDKKSENLNFGDSKILST